MHDSCTPPGAEVFGNEWLNATYWYSTRSGTGMYTRGSIYHTYYKIIRVGEGFATRLRLLWITTCLLHFTRIIDGYRVTVVYVSLYVCISYVYVLIVFVRIIRRVVVPPCSKKCPNPSRYVSFLYHTHNKTTL